MRAAIIGGDKRMLYAAKAFYDSGFEVMLSGFDGLSSLCGISITDPLTAAGRADFIVLPLPCVKGGRLNAPYSRETIPIEGILTVAREKPIFCGMRERLNTQRPGIYDYAAREDFAYQNAVLTAEGALELAMRAYEGSVFGAKTLVCGMGRIGRILAQYLCALGAQVTVAARKAGDRAYAEALGYHAIDYSFKEKYDFDLIFNTVPARVLGARELRLFKDDVLLIDLASLPGGIDMTAATARELSAIHALSLPAKCAPASAGRIIKETIIKMIKEEDGGKEEDRLCADGVVLHL